MKDVASHKELGTDSDRAPDLALYPKGNVSRKAMDAYRVDPKESSASAARKPWLARTAWPWIMLPIQVKVKRPGFVFEEDPRILRNLARGGDEARSQHATQAAEIFLRQHRTHVFSLYIYRDRARIFRWDRAGILVTGAFNIAKEPQKLLNFFYRLGRLSRKQLGFSTSAKVAKARDIEYLETYTSDNKDEKELIKEIYDKQDKFPIYKVRILPSRLDRD